MTVDLMPWECDSCHLVYDIEPHFPHDVECPGGDCICDYIVCPDCCWANECHEVPA